MPISNLPASQSTPGTVSITQPAVVAPAPSADPKIRKLIQQKLVLLLHVDKCQKKGKQANGEVRQCVLPHVLTHMTTCAAGKSCPTPHCSSPSQIMSHWKNCIGGDCPVCLPLKQASDRQQQAVNEQAPPQCSPQSLNHIQNPQTTQKPPSQVQLRPTLQNGAADAIVSHSAQKFLNAPPSQVALVVPGVIPDSSATVKDWHQSVTQDLRHKLVGKMVKAIFPEMDVICSKDIRLVNLFTYVRKVEGYMYGAANSIGNSLRTKLGLATYI